MIEHGRDGMDIKTILHFDGRPSERLVRIPCSCGWRGSWFSTIDQAEISFRRHMSNVVCGPVPVSA